MTDIESAEDAPNPVAFWRDQLKLSLRQDEQFYKDGEVAVARYRSVPLSDYVITDEGTTSKFNILWSNTETLKPAVYSALPSPDVRIRNFVTDMNDPAEKARAEVANEASQVLEKALSTTIDDGTFDVVMKECRDDVLLPGRGQIRIRYEVEWENVIPEAVEEFQRNDDGEIETDADGPIVINRTFMHNGEPIEVERDDDGEIETNDADMPIARVKASEAVKAEYVFWGGYRQQPARNWAQTDWIAYEHFMTREQLTEEFGSVGNDIPLESRREVGAKEENKPGDTGIKVARVWEIYDKTDEERVWIADGFDKLIEKEDDPLELVGFYPSPKPLTFYTTTDRTTPMSEYRFYQDQAIELDVVNARITRLIALLKAVGAYDSLSDAVVDVINLSDGELAPVDIGEEMRRQGGLAGSIFMWPLQTIAAVLSGLYEQRAALLVQIYELTGISDLIRGQTAPSETLGAQKLKANFGSMRMTNRHQPMQEFVRDTLRVMADMMAENFEDETWARMTGMKISPAALEMIRDDHLRYFNVDIETDSTVTPDAEMQKQEAVEMATAIAQYFTAVFPIAQADPRMVPFFLDLFKVVFR
ncbi:MAG: hypothetical protein ABUJ98_12425, partial [Hyphomicrobium sp.]